MATVVSTDKVYKLTIGNPLSYSLAARNHARFPLMWYDEKKNQNRALRYAINQKSPFEDEQDGNAIIEPIMFEDGFLSVPRTNPALQAFLHYHPLNGRVFVEVDEEKDAAYEVESFDLEIDALIEARKLSLEQIETLTRVMFGKDPSTISTAELNDPELQFQAKVRKFFEEKLLALRNGDKEVWFNTPTNKKKMVSVPFGEDPYDIAGYFLSSDDGIDSLKMLEANLPQ
jgi:hypothetical protein